MAEILAVNYAYDIDQPVAECHDWVCGSEKLDKD